MATQEGDNLSVVGINGNFDDAQRSVKEMFVDEGLKANLKATGRAMSSANSINWGRLAPQIAYYISSYADLVACGEIDNGDKVNFVVPTGNFGNILAGYYAYRMGLPVNKLIVASNANNVLTDFFNEGKYSVNRNFYKTSSPSMDILVSSNLERLLFELSGRDCDLMKKIYADLKEKGEFAFDINLLRNSIFEAGWADETETKEAIQNYFDLDDVTFDPHTAVAGSVYNDYSIDTEDDTTTIIVSTASPYKFPVDVLEALTGKTEKDAFKAMLKLQNESGMDCPGELYYLNEKKIIHKKVVKIEDVKQAVLDFVLDTTRG
jgi:threonine synthase